MVPSASLLLMLIINGRNTKERNFECFVYLSSGGATAEIPKYSRYRDQQRRTQPGSMRCECYRTAAVAPSTGCSTYAKRPVHEQEQMDQKLKVYFKWPDPFYLLDGSYFYSYYFSLGGMRYKAVRRLKMSPINISFAFTLQTTFSLSLSDFSIVLFIKWFKAKIESKISSRYGERFF